MRQLERLTKGEKYVAFVKCNIFVCESNIK